MNTKNIETHSNEIFLIISKIIDLLPIINDQKRSITHNKKISEKLCNDRLKLNINKIWRTSHHDFTILTQSHVIRKSHLTTTFIEL